jgi:TonB family protein
MIPPPVIRFAPLLLAAAFAQAPAVEPPVRAEPPPGPTAPPASGSPAAPAAQAAPLAIPDAAPAAVPPSPEGEAPTGVLTLPPELLQFVPAPYPPEAEAAGITGSVTFAIVIAEDGSVAAVRVVDPGPHPAFAPAAEAAVRGFKFRAAEIDGKPAAVEIEYRYDFVIRKAAPAAPAEAPVLLSGRVIERGTRTPLGGVAVEAAGVATETDATGRFALRGLPAGQVKVTVVSPEHEPLTVTETIATDKAVEVEYRLTRRHYDPYEAVVRGERPRKEVAVRTISTDEVRTVPGTQGDVIKVLQNLPGVARSPFGIGLLVVRGSDPNDTKVFLDGVPIPLVFHFGGITSVVSSDVIEGLDFYPGNFGSRFGRATGGVVEIRTRDAKDAFHGLVQADVYDGRAQLEGPLLGGTLVLSVRRSWVDAALRLVLPRISPEANRELRIAPRYYDYQAKYTRPLGAGTLSISAFGSDDKLEFVRAVDQAGAPTFYLNTLFHRGSARWRVASGALQNDLVLYAGKDGFNILQGTNVGVLTDVWNVGVRETARWKLSDALTLETGLDLVERRFHYSLYRAKQDAPGAVGSSGAGQGTILDEKASGSWFSPGAWVEAEWQPAEPVRLVAGLRADFDSRLRSARGWLDPRATAFWTVRPGTVLSAAAGLFGKPPEPGELTRLFGNPELVPSRAAQYSAGIRQELPWGASLEATGFYKSLWRLVTFTNATRPDGSLVRDSNEGRGEAIGAEFLLRKDLAKGLFGWIAYTWSRSLRLDDPTVGSYPDWHLFALDQTHNLTLVLSWRLPGEWILGSRVRLVSGNPYTPYVGHVLDADTGRYQCVPSNDVLSRRLSPFFQADARVDKRWVYESWMFSLYLDVQNVTNRTNAEFRAPTYDCGGQVVIPGLPILPSFGLRAEW